MSSWRGTRQRWVVAFAEDRECDRFPARASATPAASPNNDLQSALEGLRNEIFGDALNQVDTQVGLVTRLLDDAGISTKSAELVIPEMETGQHTWVQVASGTTWIDLHPTLADLPTGGTAGSTMAALPEEWFHTITIRVAHEEASAGSLTRVVSLDQTFRSQSAVGGNLALIHIDGAQMNQLGIDLGGALEGQRKYYPLLFLGADLQYGTAPMTFGGQGGILDALSGTSDLPDGEAVAEYLEIEIHSPGADPVATSRTIFDRIADQRAAASVDLSRIKPIDEVDVGGDAKRYLPLAPLVSFGAIMGRLPSAFTLIQPPESSQFSSFSDAPRSIQAVGQTIADRSASGARSEFIDRPNLISYTYAPAKSADGSLSTAHITADLLVQSRAGASDDRSRPFGIESGVRAQVAEEMVLDSRLLTFMSSQGYSPTIPGAIGPTVGRVFRQAEADAVPIKVLTSAADLTAGGITIADSAQGLIASHLDQGRVVIVPSAPVTIDGEEALGWWVYNPADGSLIDQMTDGRSAAYLVTMAEFSAKLRMIYIAAAPFLANGECVAAVLNAANDILTGGFWAPQPELSRNSAPVRNARSRGVQLELERAARFDDDAFETLLGIGQDDDGIGAGRNIDRIAADRSAGDFVAVRIEHPERRLDSLRDGLIKLLGIGRVEVCAVADPGPIPELRAQGVIIERKADDVDLDIDSLIDQRLDRRRRIAAARLFAVRDQHNDFRTLDPGQVVRDLLE